MGSEKTRRYSSAVLSPACILVAAVSGSRGPLRGTGRTCDLGAAVRAPASAWYTLGSFHSDAAVVSGGLWVPFKVGGWKLTGFCVLETHTGDTPELRSGSVTSSKLPHLPVPQPNLASPVKRQQPPGPGRVAQGACRALTPQQHPHSVSPAQAPLLSSFHDRHWESHKSPSRHRGAEAREAEAGAGRRRSVLGPPRSPCARQPNEPCWPGASTSKHIPSCGSGGHGLHSCFLLRWEVQSVPAFLQGGWRSPPFLALDPSPSLWLHLPWPPPCVRVSVPGSPLFIRAQSC